MCAHEFILARVHIRIHKHSCSLASVPAPVIQLAGRAASSAFSKFSKFSSMQLSPPVGSLFSKRCDVLEVYCLATAYVRPSQQNIFKTYVRPQDTYVLPSRTSSKHACGGHGISYEDKSGHLVVACMFVVLVLAC